MIIYRLTISSLLILVLIGCSESITIHRAVPAEFVLNSGESIIIANRFDHTALELKGAEEKKLNVYSKGISTFLQKLQSEISVLENANVALLGEGNFQNSSPDLFNIKMDSLCRNTNTDLYFVLNDYTLDMIQTGVEKDEDGDKIASYDLKASCSLELYSCDTNQKIKDFNQSARVDYKDRMVLSGLLARGPSLKKAEDEAEVVSNDLAIFLVDRFHPTDIAIDLYYYNGKSMKEAAQFIRNEDYNAALQLLSDLANNTDAEIAGEAANNLYVVYEILGDNEQSQYWYNQAKKLNQLHSLNQLDY